MSSIQRPETYITVSNAPMYRPLRYPCPVRMHDKTMAQWYGTVHGDRHMVTWYGRTPTQYGTVHEVTVRYMRCRHRVRYGTVHWNRHLYRRTAVRYGTWGSGTWYGTEHGELGAVRVPEPSGWIRGAVKRRRKAASERNNTERIVSAHGTVQAVLGCFGTWFRRYHRYFKAATGNQNTYSTKGR